MAYQELVEIDGYTRSYGGFKRIAARLKDLKPSKKKKKKRKLKPYRRADYPGQKIQIDVKYVPSYCVADGRKYYQYTAVDECSRWTYREMYDEHSTYSSKDFLLKLMNEPPFQSVKCRQTMDLSYESAFFRYRSHTLIFYYGIRQKNSHIFSIPQKNGK